jgi:hypothetical protein
MYASSLFNIRLFFRRLFKKEFGKFLDSVFCGDCVDKQPFAKVGVR